MGWLGAMNGGAQAFANVADTYIKKWNEQDLMATREQMDIEKEKRIEEAQARSTGRELDAYQQRKGIDSTQAQSDRESQFNFENDPKNIQAKANSKQEMINAEFRAKDDHFKTELSQGELKAKQEARLKNEQFPNELSQAEQKARLENKLKDERFGTELSQGEQKARAEYNINHPNSDLDTQLKQADLDMKNIQMKVVQASKVEGLNEGERKMLDAIPKLIDSKYEQLGDPNLTDAEKIDIKTSIKSYESRLDQMINKGVGLDTGVADDVAKVRSMIDDTDDKPEPKSIKREPNGNGVLSKVSGVASKALEPDDPEKTAKENSERREKINSGVKSFIKDNFTIDDKRQAWVDKLSPKDKAAFDRLPYGKQMAEFKKNGL